MTNSKPSLLNNVTRVATPDYNYRFDKRTGYFARWGVDVNDDPVYSPLGPEIADIEISTICHGVGSPCKFCYKKNTQKGKHMTLDTFKRLFAKLPKNVTQIAFGIGDTNGNPDMFAIFEYTRENGVIPNVTINGEGLTPELADRFANVCGAVAVSRYKLWDVCYDAVEMLVDAGLEQVNIHMLVSEETYADCDYLIDDVLSDTRLSGLKAVVFLALKQKGRGKGMTPLAFPKYKKLVERAFDAGISIGFDSCSAPKFLKTITDRPDYDTVAMYAEPCESGLFSSYINVDGVYFPCSFGEFQGEGISVLDCDDFLQDVWYHPDTIEWRKELIENNRECPLYNI